MTVAPGILARLEHPLVSVIVPAYNVARYIEATLESLRRQTLGDFEIVVVDDASTDDTVAVVERWQDPRLRLFRHATNSGVAAARNTAFEHARGRYLALLDPDDVAFPQRLERQVAALEMDPALGMIGAADAVMDESGAPMDQIWRHATDPVEASAGMLFENTFSTSALMIRAEALGGQRYLAMRISEDYELNARIARAWKVCNLAEPLVWRRRRTDGLTATLPEQMLRANRSVIRDHLEYLGIQPSDREVELCLHLGKEHLTASLELLGEIDSWLGKLLRANGASQRFEAVKFTRLLARRWFEICKSSSHLGTPVLRRYIRGVAAQPLQPGVHEWSRFVAKCVIRHTRRGSTQSNPPAAQKSASGTSRND